VKGKNISGSREKFQGWSSVTGDGKKLGARGRGLSKLGSPLELGSFLASGRFGLRFAYFHQVLFLFESA
jgi:hypothetical protein